MDLRTPATGGGIAALRESAATQAPVEEAETRPSGRSLWHTFRERYTRSRAGPELPQPDDQVLVDIALDGAHLEPASAECQEQP
jgi:hypothetical protein